MALYVFLLSSILSQTAAATDRSHFAERIKSAFILNISRFVYWPDNALPDDGKFQMCTFLDNSLGSSFGHLAGRKINGRTVSIKIIKDLSEAEKCQTLFISSHHIEELVAPIQIKHLLTIGDLTETQRKFPVTENTIISLLRKGSRINIGIHRKAAAANHLKLSSELLKLGKMLDKEGF